MELLLVAIALAGLYLIYRGRRHKTSSIWFEGVILRPEDLAVHARELAKFHRVRPARCSCNLIMGRLRDNFNYITKVYREAAEDLRLERQVASAGEWLLDNYYVIEEQVKEILLNVKRGRFQDLPVLSNGSLKGSPRIYAIALEVISHSDGSLNEPALHRFIEAYQEEVPLAISEIWSLALMVRIALVEKIRHVCQLLESTHRQWRLAESFLARTKPEKLREKIFAQGKLPFAFAEHLLELIRHNEAGGKQVRDLLAEKLLQQDSTLEKMVHSEHQAKAAQTTSMSNAVSSLKGASTLDWDQIFENLCQVNEILRADEVYGEMDFPSRNYYRRQVQRLARMLHISETRLAKLALECAQEAEGSPRQQHCGYYLLDQGQKVLQAKVGARYRLKKLSSAFYVLIIAGLSLAQALFTGALARPLGSGWALSLGLAFFLPASEIAVSLLNRVLANLRPPAFLPKLEYRSGIPAQAATLVVIPALLPNAQRTQELIRRLEVHFLANPQANLFFALLGDFPDAAGETEADDEEIMQKALAQIEKLNEKYPARPFYFFIRRRQFSQTQGKWLGWERKRGALVELNALLMGSKGTSFISPPPSLPGVCYVLTVDADTRLPLGAARKLVGTIAHPLHKLEPAAGNRPACGYGLIQPRIGVSIESINKSFFAQVMAGPGGTDTYANAISDVYMDWFGQGVFTGKGIYDLEAAHKLLATAPENSILSHDLLEGGLLRVGLVTDIDLVDDFPARVDSYSARGHRWTRGDWQLLPWLGSAPGGRKNPLNLICRWQIFDNLRRSMVPIGQILFLALAILSPGRFWLWAALFMGAMFLPTLFSFLDYNWRGYLNDKFSGGRPSRGRGPGLLLHRLVWQLAFLPQVAWQNGDAALRTLYRLFVSRKNLLEWTTAAEAEKRGGGGYSRRFQSALLVTAAFTLLLAYIRPASLLLYLPLLALWLYSPSLAARISREEDTRKTVPLGDRIALRKLALETWLYYEDLVDAETNFLPPDNYQEEPPTGSDYRTSPTNIGFYLLSALAARDFGFITSGEMVERVEKCLGAVEKMDKWRGHLFNWYAVRDLELLRPRFISSVDSGNFACMLVVLRQGLEEYLHRPLFDQAAVLGLLETRELGGTPLFRNTLESWEDILAQPVHGASPRGQRLLSRHREELAAVMPQTEILLHPPEFLKREPRYHRLGQLAEKAVLDPSLANLPRYYQEMAGEIEALMGQAANWQREYLALWQDDLQRAAVGARQMVDRIKGLEGRIEALINKMDFSALYNFQRNLFSIGYSVDEERLSESNYDLLASESRLTSYLAVVLRQAPPKHWLQLGRALVRVEGAKALVSWSGTMFEYFMPLLFMKNYANTFLAETADSVIYAQRQYAGKHKLPWGVSESGYYAFDYRLNYQYRAFGIPKLGLKRGLVADMVVSPYSTLLTLPFAPEAAMENIRFLLAEGGGGRYGLFEAVDYTPSRLPRQEKKAVVQSYFAHHQGMSLISLANSLGDFAMVRRFHSDPRIRAGELMLQETPSRQPVLSRQVREPVLQARSRDEDEKEVVRSFGLPSGMPPNCHLLSNGSYTVLLTDSGSGYSRNENVQINRWREIPGYKFGTFIFVKSLNTDRVWSATTAPLHEEPDFYRVRFFQDRASYFREMANIDARTEVVVATEDNAEVRRVSLTNHGIKEASLEITSFFELALSHQGADLAHPAFNNLFVETEALLQYNALLAFRRPRTGKAPDLFALHQVTVEGESIGVIQFETDRGKFIGRGRDIANPIALHQPLGNTSGRVLDPAMSLRRQLRLGPGKSAAVTFITAQGATRSEMLKAAVKYSDLSAVQRAFDMAYTRSRVEKRFLNLNPQLLAASQQAVGHLIFQSPSRRQYEELLARNSLAQPSLWAQGISGDNPIVLVLIEDIEKVRIAEEAILAHEYWRFKGLTVDLVILHGGEGGYHEPVRDLVREMVQLYRISEILDKPGGIYIRGMKQLTPGERSLFYGAARLILGPGSLAEQLQAGTERDWPEAKVFRGKDWPSAIAVALPEGLLFNNGLGGFCPAKGEYCLQVQPRMTPAPWLNVLANPDFGCIVSERGGGYTFAENSRENKLTPWSNDPVSDPPGEVVYLRDEEAGAVWSVTPAPVLELQPYLVRHGLGYSKFSHHSHGLDQELTVFVPQKDSVKISLLRVRNDSPVRRQLTATYFLRPVLGVSEQISHLHLVSAWQDNLLTFRNSYNADFPERRVWLCASKPVLSYTGDAWEFLGAAAEMSRPAALKRKGLSNTVGAGLHPGGAVQVAIDLYPGQEEELVFQLGQAQNLPEAGAVAAKYNREAQAALQETQAYWRALTGTVTVKTPELALDMLLAWLLYQTIVCRMWARSGFYQCGGAFGFRDQLQDAANLVLVAPELTRKQILLHAAHQFLEGDVQHWWHPGTVNRGVRTRFSDDLLWLPWAVAEYIERTGDKALLEEEAPFLTGKLLETGVDEHYAEAETTAEKGKVYEHCLRAIARALRFGSHGIPLMGSGDWNDGMNNVGPQGKGESIWLGWFLFDILQRFAPFCADRGEEGRAKELLSQAEKIRQAIESKGWDGRWYRRAYFDDGSPLGSAENPECSIDSIPQTWAVISGGGRRDRIAEAMGEVETHLVREDDGMILLFTPPFDSSPLQPGYIKGYVPGVRENGGQYTHAACWAIQAMTLLGHGDKAMEWFQYINPINHSRTPIESSRYRVEPYVLAADVYAAAGQVGRGGWTWYTGAAGWLYRVCLENILGLQRRGNTLRLEPCIPRGWQEYNLEYRFGSRLYAIKVLNPQGVSRGVVSLRVNGVPCQEVELREVGEPVQVIVVMG